MTYSNTNEDLVRELVHDGYLKSPRIIEAFKKIDRKDFLPSGREAALRGVPPNLQKEAYENYPLPIGEGQTISQPLTVAFMLELLDPRPGDKILDVGSGSGWTTALLVQIVSGVKSHGSRVGTVVAIERVPELCKMGERNIDKYGFIKNGIVKIFCGDASRGVPKEFLPPGGFDKILAGAAAQTEIPGIWKKQLKIGGRIVAPIGQSVIVLDKVSENKFKEKEYMGFSFVPLVSGE